jgi:hypothetical protein
VRQLCISPIDFRWGGGAFTRQMLSWRCSIMGIWLLVTACGPSEPTTAVVSERLSAPETPSGVINNTAVDIVPITVRVDARPAPIEIHSAREFIASHEVPAPDPIQVVPVPTQDTVISQIQQWAKMSSRVAVAKITHFEVHPKVLAANIDPVLQIKTVATLESVEGKVGDVDTFALHQPSFIEGQGYLIFFQDNLAFKAIRLITDNTISVDGVAVDITTVKGALR